MQQPLRQVYEFFLKFTVVAKVRHLGRVPGDLCQMPAVSWSLAAPLLRVYELFLNFTFNGKLLGTGARSVFAEGMESSRKPHGFPTFSYRTTPFLYPYFHPETP